MTAFLASVRSAAEARLVLHAGVDVLDVKEPDAGALGAVADTTLREIITCATGAVPVSATIGDLPLVPEQVVPAIERTWQTGVDIVKVGVFAEEISAPVISLLAGFSARGMRIVLVYFAEQWRGVLDGESLRQSGVMGIMLDTRDKGSGSLTSKLGHAGLADFLRQARQAGLVAGLAGSLRETEIPGLLALRPDYLGFRGALCGDAGRAALVDVAVVRRIANRIRETGPRPNLIAARGDRIASTNSMSA
jgi:uncharacterized protein (UPF0264 family)